jgi:magnesium-transporting ATPase (P-type)
MKTVCQHIKECFEDFILQILLAAALVSLVIGVVKDGWIGSIDGVSIFMAIIVITLITVVNNYTKDRQF